MEQRRKPIKSLNSREEFIDKLLMDEGVPFQLNDCANKQNRKRSAVRFRESEGHSSMRDLVWRNIGPYEYSLAVTVTEYPGHIMQHSIGRVNAC